MFSDERMKIFVVIGNKLGVLVFKDFVILWVKGKNNIGYYYLVIVNQWVVIYQFGDFFLENQKIVGIDIFNISRINILVNLNYVVRNFMVEMYDIYYICNIYLYLFRCGVISRVDFYLVQVIQCFCCLYRFLFVSINLIVQCLCLVQY